MKKEIVFVDLLECIIDKKISFTANSTNKNLVTFTSVVENTFVGIVEIKANCWSDGKIISKNPYSISFNILELKTEITVIGDEVVTVEEKWNCCIIHKFFMSENLKKKLDNFHNKIQK